MDEETVECLRKDIRALLRKYDVVIWFKENAEPGDYSDDRIVFKREWKEVFGVRGRCLSQSDVNFRPGGIGKGFVKG